MAGTSSIRVEPMSFDTDNSKMLWLGVPNIASNMLKKYDPAFKSNVHIFLIRNTPIFDTFFPDSHYQTLKVAFESLTTSMNGIPDLTLNSQDQTHSFSDRKFPHATYSESNFDTISFNWLDFKGLPVWRMLNDWINYISDENTKIKDYQGNASKIAGGYSTENHTCSILIGTADPTNNYVQGRAHYITAMFPTTVPMNMYEKDDNDMSIVGPYSVPFKGLIKHGDDIDIKFVELLRQRMKMVNYYAAKDKSLSNEVR